MNLASPLVLIMAAIAAVTPSQAAITVYTDRAEFTAATGIGLVETFTDDLHFPINGILNSTTTEAGLAEGDILPGVTYSTVPGSLFLINSGEDFEGGFLDSLYPYDPGALTFSFDSLQSGFGFDTNVYMDRFIITIFSDDGILFTEAFAPQNSASLQFFGFASSEDNIRSAVLSPESLRDFNFALDNFTFNGLIPIVTSSGPPVPEPATWALLISGFGLIGAAARRRRLQSAPDHA